MVVFSKNLYEWRGCVCCGGNGVFLDFNSVVGDFALCVNRRSSGVAVYPVYYQTVVVHWVVFSLAIGL